MLLRSRDEGQSWEEISPDLTRNDKAKQGEVRRADHARQHGRRGLRHDLRPRRVAGRAGRALGGHRRRAGARHARRRQDTGRTSRRKGMPEWIRINSIDASPHDKGDGLRRGDDVQARRLPAVSLQDERLRQDVDEDRRRHSRRTPSRASSARTRARAGCSTPAPRLGLYVSFDDGANWQPFQLQPARRAGHRPAVKDGDLVVATQGRVVLDPRRPHARCASTRTRSRAAAVHLFPPRPTVRAGGSGFGGGDEEGSPAAIGKNPPNGVARVLLAQGEAGGEGEAHDRVPRRRQGPALLHEREEGQGRGGRRSRKREAAETTIAPRSRSSRRRD